MKYRTIGKVEQGVVDETLNGQEMADQFCGLADRAPEVYPVIRYQEQYDSIMNETMTLPEYKKPQPARQQIRKMLIRTARDQMFASMEEGADKGQAIADYVNMTEERAYQDALHSWEKEKKNFETSALRHWKEYATAMKPLLDNDAAYVEKKIARWLDLVELPVGFDLSFEAGDDSVYVEIDGSQIRSDIEKYVSDNVDDVFTTCVTGVARCMAAGIAGIAIGADTLLVEVTEKDGSIIYQEELNR